MFYSDDVTNIEYNGKREFIQTLNGELNFLSKKLSEKGIKLIVLPSPDKYDIYYEFIANNKLPKNIFFDTFEKENKEYIYVNTKDALLKHVNAGEKDVYFADDTHWSPIGSEIVANEILKCLNTTEQLSEVHKK